jgi:hypothetical protein
MIVWKLLTFHDSWLWTAGVIFWLVRRPLVERDGRPARWWR